MGSRKSISKLWTRVDAPPDAAALRRDVELSIQCGSARHAVDVLDDEVDLVDVEDVHLVGVVLERPFLDGPGLDGMRGASARSKALAVDVKAPSSSSEKWIVRCTVGAGRAAGRSSCGECARCTGADGGLGSAVVDGESEHRFRVQVARRTCVEAFGDEGGGSRAAGHDELGTTRRRHDDVIHRHRLRRARDTWPAGHRLRRPASCSDRPVQVEVTMRAGVKMRQNWRSPGGCRSRPSVTPLMVGFAPGPAGTAVLTTSTLGRRESTRRCARGSCCGARSIGASGRSEDRAGR